MQLVDDIQRGVSYGRDEGSRLEYKWNDGDIRDLPNGRIPYDDDDLLKTLDHLHL